MLRKLYALVSKSCSVDNPDSPQHQEVLLPGTLYGMIIKERLEEALNSFREGIALDVRNSNPAVDFFDSTSLPTDSILPALKLILSQSGTSRRC